MIIWLTATGVFEASARRRRSEYLKVADTQRVEDVRRARKERKIAIIVLSLEVKVLYLKAGLPPAMQAWPVSTAPSYTPSHLSR